MSAPAKKSRRYEYRAEVRIDIDIDSPRKLTRDEVESIVQDAVDNQYNVFWDGKDQPPIGVSLCPDDAEVDTDILDDTNAEDEP